MTLQDSPELGGAHVSDAEIKAFREKYREIFPGSHPDRQTIIELLKASKAAVAAASEAFRSAFAAASPAVPSSVEALDIETQAWECDKWPVWLHNIVDRTNEAADRLDMSSEQACAYAVLATLSRPSVAEGAVKALEWVDRVTARAESLERIGATEDAADLRALLAALVSQPLPQAGAETIGPWGWANKNDAVTRFGHKKWRELGHELTPLYSAASIAQLQQRIAELDAECVTSMKTIADERAAREAAEAKLAEAVEVLEPFAAIKFAWRGDHVELAACSRDEIDGVLSLTMGDFRRARSFRAEAAERVVVAAWNAFGGKVVDEYDEIPYVIDQADGDLAEQIRALTQQRDAAEAKQAEAVEKEREECAKVAESLAGWMQPRAVAFAIRARARSFRASIGEKTP